MHQICTIGETTLKKSLLFCLVFITNTAYATNGINLIGFGAESTLMAGADIPVARDTSALNTNPAGLTQITSKRYDIYGSLLRITDLSHQDQLNDDNHATNLYTGLGGMGYAQHIDNTACTAGLGLFAQGGSGGIFEQVNTAFGTKDEFSALFAVAKLTSGLGCKVNDNWSVGGSFGLVYAAAEQKIFPNTSQGSFAGIDIQDATSLETSFKLGVQYRATPKLTLAATYTSKTELPLTGGKLKLNLTDAGLGIVSYKDVTIEGLALPREIAVGAAYQMNEKWLLAMKLNWINWSDAMKNTVLTAKSPNNPLATNIESTSTMDWDDQWVLATGIAYNYSDKTTLYAGYNYGKNPIPAQHSNLTVAGIFEHHFTFGAGYQYSPLWTVFAGIEYDVGKKVNYTNPELPFGENAQLRNEAVWLHMMVSRQW
ncbi:MAG TPA: aromatic hydrocarbon degradation protein [Methylophaga sp.]|nr:aromatic hydrocarbon degradation protein [Methylophaga sp.]